jgi:hypothetical protein
MKELREQSRTAAAVKLRAMGGSVKHSDVKEDKALIRAEVKPEALKRAFGGAADGPSMGGVPSKPHLGKPSRRSAKGGKGHKGTNVNVIVSPPAGAGPAPAPLPVPLPPAGNAPIIPPRPMPPVSPGLGAGPGAPIPMPPRPIPGSGGPLACGGEVKRRAAGGKVKVGDYPIEDGAMSGEGRLEKIASYGKNARTKSSGE